MTINKYVEQKFPIECKGRDSKGNRVLEKPTKADVFIHKRSGSNIISSIVECPYISGGHGEKCRASNDNAYCPYAFDIPYALEIKKK
jgi:hypothetical protein